MIGARRSGEARVASMNRHIFSIVLSLAATVISGAIFLDSLFRQFALVEIAASLLTALQVFFLSSAIADTLEKQKKTSRSRNSWVVAFTVFLIAFYSFTRYLR
jgi:membrane protein DedA with SNARE-associated domain